MFRTPDGGRTWKKILYRNERTGAIDLVLDPTDPQVLYATLWEVYRRPWKLWSGGEGSGIFKSTDGGETWSELTGNPGFPQGVLGKIAVTEDRLRQADSETLRETARSFVERISAVEEELYQVKNQSPKDKIAFPIKLNDRLTGLRSHLERGDAAPSKAYRQVFEELSAELAAQLGALEQALSQELPRLNRELESLGLGKVTANEREASNG